MILLFFLDCLVGYANAGALLIVEFSEITDSIAKPIPDFADGV